MAVPLMVDEESRNDAYWKEMRDRLSAMGCQRVFLTMQGKGAAAPIEHFRKYVPELARLGKFFREAGIESGIWLGHTIGHSASLSGKETPFTSIVGCTVQGELTTENGVFCPLDPKFQAYISEICATLASSGLPLLMLDDDFRLGYHGKLRFGCFCPEHLKWLKKTTGLELTAPEAAEKFRSNLEIRRALCRNNSESLLELAGRIGKAVHAVAPETRIGIASCSGLWTGDGVDVATLLNTFNQNGTRPFLRIGAAPFWSRIADHTGMIVEYARLQASWVSDKDIEIFAEGDTFPHSTFYTPASSLSAYDLALSAAGFPGILSYQYSYGDYRTSDFNYEQSTYSNRPFHAALRKYSPASWKECGFEYVVTPQEFLYRKPDAPDWAEFHAKIKALEILPRLGIPVAFGNPQEPVLL